MNRIYEILLENKLIGTTAFERADPPMGVVFGDIQFISDIEMQYDFIKSYCIKNHIEFNDYPGDKMISTQTLSLLKVISDRGQEIDCVGNQISGMDSDVYELSIEGIPYPFYEEEFSHHVQEYRKRFE